MEEAEKQKELETMARRTGEFLLEFDRMNVVICTSDFLGWALIVGHDEEKDFKKEKINHS